MERVLLTGGAGYIGSHTAALLLKNGYEVVIADNLANSRADVIDRLETVTGRRPVFCRADLTDPDAAEAIFAAYDFDAVIHFAGLKAVGESVREPLSYYRCNLGSAVTVLEAMRRHGVRRFIFSSSATVYGAKNPIPYREDMEIGGCTNPYAQTKFMIEQIVRDEAAADPTFSAVLLRYFNPIGAHESGMLGELPNGIPNNLLPYVSQVAAGLRPHLNVFGDDYPTPDGTGVRDYLHVCDLAAGHVAALDYAAAHTGAEAINLGTGHGVSVLEIVHAFEEASGVKIPYVIAPRRPGDLPACWADASKAERLLGWRAEKTVADMCRDTWRWQEFLRTSEAK